MTPYLPPADRLPSLPSTSRQTPLPMLNKICAECASPYDPAETQAGVCLTCKPQRPMAPALTLEHSRKYPKENRHERGYDNRWANLSARARRLQPFCTDCGTIDNLTADHSTTAWKRRDEGRTIRLEDIDVVCVSCNAARGPARGDGANDDLRTARQDDVDNLDELIARGLAEPE